MARVLPRRLAPVLPTTYSPKYLPLAKAYAKTHKHVGFPPHAFAHWEVFVPAALRGARASISVPFSGRPLSRPLRIFGLVGRYLTNYLIRRHLILGVAFLGKNIPVTFLYPGLASVSQGYPRPKGRLMTCY